MQIIVADRRSWLALTWLAIMLRSPGRETRSLLETFCCYADRAVATQDILAITKMKGC